MVDGSYTAPSTTGTYHVVVASVADPTKTATASVTVSAAPGSAVPPPAGSAKMGTNLNWCVDWDPEKLPADLMWSARPWAVGDGNGANVANWTQIDSRGWPVVPTGTTFGAIFEGNPWPGVYKLSFKNRQGTSGDTVSSYSGNITLTNRRHDSATNVTSYDVNVPTYVKRPVHLAAVGGFHGRRHRRPPHAPAEGRQRLARHRNPALRPHHRPPGPVSRRSGRCTPAGERRARLVARTRHGRVAPSHGPPSSAPAIPAGSAVSPSRTSSPWRTRPGRTSGSTSPSTPRTTTSRRWPRPSATGPTA